MLSCLLLCTSSYDVEVDVLPEVRWTPEDGYKNLKIVVEIDTEIEAEVACGRELRRRYKTLGPLRIVADRGLQVNVGSVIEDSKASIILTSLPSVSQTKK